MEKERNVEKREKSREKRENKVLLRVVDRGKEGFDREGELGGRRRSWEREKMSARKTEMKEEVEEGKQNKKRRVRRKINWRTGIATEEKTAGEREKMEKS